LILKYPKTPGNLLARGIDYSPAGFVRTVFEMGKGLTGQGFNQKAFVDSFSRATVGSTGLVGTGIILGKLGIITEAPSKDKDIRAMQKMTGQGAYQINASALKRFVMTGLNPDAAKLREGDTLVSYDWAQPAAIPLSMGAKIANKGGITNASIGAGEAIAGGVDTLAEQPLVRGLTDIAQGNKPLSQVLQDTLTGAPASFVPTLSNQIRQTTDTTARNTTGNSATETALNLVKNKVPGLSNSLPPKIDTFGNNQPVYQQGTSNLFNIFLNPAFVTHYKPTPEITEVQRLFNVTGETKQVPRVAPTTVTVNGKSTKLNPDQTTQMQQYIGSKTKDAIGQFLSSPQYQGLSDEDKVNKITSIMTDITKAAKIQLLGDNPGSISNSVQSILSGQPIAVNLPKGATSKSAKVKSAKKSKKSKVVKLASKLKAPRKMSIPKLKVSSVKGKSVKAPKLKLASIKFSKPK